MTQYFMGAKDEVRDKLDCMGFESTMTQEDLEHKFSSNGVTVRYGICCITAVRFDAGARGIRYIPVVYMAIDNYSTKITSRMHRMLSTDEDFPDSGHAIEWGIHACKANGLVGG